MALTASPEVQGGTGGFTGPVGGQSGLPSYTAGTAGSGGGGIIGLLRGVLGGKGGSSSGISGLLHGGATLLGSSLLTAGMAGNRYGQQTAGSSLETIGGAASLGYGIAPMLGASGLWGATAGIGAGLLINGYQQHSGLGVAESAGGGALLGFQLGGPVGAAIGGIVGLGVGLAGLFTQTASQKAREKIKATYGVDISDQGILQQIVNTAKQSFGGNLDTAIQSQQVRDLIQLYAMTTGQKGNFPRPMTPTSLVESGNSVSQQPTYINGAAISSLGGTLPTVSYPTAPVVSLAQIGASSPGSAPTAISIPITSSLDGKVLADHTVNVIAQNGRVVSAAVVAGQLASSGRRQTAANLLSPRTLLQ